MLQAHKINKSNVTHVTTASIQSEALPLKLGRIHKLIITLLIFYYLLIFEIDCLGR
jgi:hypothetical protein